MDILAIGFLIAGCITGIKGFLITSLSISGVCFLISLLYTSRPDTLDEKLLDNKKKERKDKKDAHALSILVDVIIITIAIINLVK